MVKTKDEAKNDNRESKIRKNLGSTLIWAISLVALGGLGYGAWQNRVEIKGWLDELTAPKKDEVMAGQVDDLQQQLAELQNRLSAAEYAVKHPDFSEMQKRIEDIEQISVNTIKSKADVEALLGLVVRMDNAEEKLRSLAKVTDDGALILTAAMLVKEAGERGGKFVYETEVLSELTRENVKVKNEVAKLEEIATRGVPSVGELQKEFVELYVARYPEDVEEEDTATNWKERIYNKLHKIVKIKKADEQVQTEKKEFSEEDRAWNVLRDFVLSGEIIRAVGIAEKPLNRELLENESFSAWLKNAQTYRDFYESISRITANGLAVMKVKFLKN